METGHTRHTFQLLHLVGSYSACTDVYAHRGYWNPGPNPIQSNPYQRHPSMHHRVRLPLIPTKTSNVRLSWSGPINEAAGVRCLSARPPGSPFLTNSCRRQRRLHMSYVGQEAWGFLLWRLLAQSAEHRLDVLVKRRPRPDRRQRPFRLSEKPSQLDWPGLKRSAVPVSWLLLGTARPLFRIAHSLDNYG